MMDITNALMREMLSNYVTSIQSLEIDTGDGKKSAQTLNGNIMEQTVRRGNLADFIKVVLEESGLNVSAENVEILKNMLENELPLNKDTILKFARALRLTDGNAENAAFMLKNELPLNNSNAKIVEEFAKGEMTLKQNLDVLSEEIAKMPEGAVKTEVLETFLGKNEQPLDSVTENINNLKKSVQNNKLAENVVKSDLKEVIVEKENKAEVIVDTKIGEKTPENISEKPILVKKDSGLIDREKMSTEDKTPQKELVKSVVKEIKHMKHENIEVKVKNVPQKTEELVEIQTNVLKSAEKQEVEKNENVAKNDFTRAELPKNAEVKQERPELLQFPKPTVSKEEIKIALQKRFSVEPLRGREEIDNVLQNLKDAAETAKHVLRGLPEGEKVSTVLDNITKNLNFSENVKTLIFTQIPLIAAEPTEARIVVFREKSRRRRGKSDSAAALVDIDLAALGRVETFVQKNDKNVYCSFRLGDEETGKILQENISILQNAIAAAGFRLEGTLFSPFDEPSSPIGLSSKKGKIDEKTVLFDMTV